MSERMERNLIIPSFAISSINRKPIDKELEVAFIYYMVEKEKKRSIIGKQQEMVSFIVRAYYGIWAYPINNKWIFIDPIKLHSFYLKAVDLPPLEEFISQLKDAHNSRNLFNSLLVTNDKTFSQFKKKDYNVIGLINKPLALAITNYIRDVGVDNILFPNSLMLPLKLDEKDMLEVIYELNKVRKELENDIIKLEETIKVLDEETSFHITQIDEEIISINNEYKSQMEVTTEIINRSIEQLKMKKDLEIKMVLSRFEERKELFNSQIREYRKLLMYLKKDYETLKEMINSSKSSPKDKIYIDLWGKILKDISSRMEGIEKEIDQIQTVMKTLDNERGKEVSSIESAYKQLIESKMKSINDLEIEKELEVRKRREEAKELSNKVMSLRRQILDMQKQVRISLEQIEQLPLQEFNGNEPKLLCIPFYLICYEDMKGGKRYKTYPPSIIQFPSHPPLKWMHGISSPLLRPYSGQIMSIFEEFIEYIKTDPIFEGEIYKIGKNLDLLTSFDIKKQIYNAINTLMNQGLIPHKQASLLKKSLKVNFSPLITYLFNI
ncbi:MAG: hypothetical protein QXP55_04285 [Nitrososphaerales archaeon]